MFDSIKKGISFSGIISISLFLYLGTVYFSFAIPNILLGVMISVFFIAVASKKISLQFSKKNWIKFGILALPFILTVLSVLLSDNMIIGQKYIQLRLPLLVIPFVIVFTKFEDSDIKKGALVFIVATILASLITCYNAIRYVNEDILFKTEFAHFITIIQHPYFGLFVLAALVLLLELKLIKLKGVKIAVCALFGIVIILTTSRLVYILFLAYTFYYLYNSVSRKWFFSVSVVITILAAVFMKTNPNVIYKFKSMVDYKNSPRLQLWHNSMELIKSQSAYVFGMGIGDYYENKKDPYYALGKNDGIVLGLNPHSQPMEFYITNGIFGVLALAISIFYLIGFYLKQQKGVAIFLCSMIFLFSLTECIFTRQFGVQLYVVLVPLLLKQNFKR